MGDNMQRREFITLLGGTVATWPLAARAQQSERVRVVCFLSALSADLPIAKAEETAFLEGLQQLGWAPGGHVRMEFRWSGGDEAKARKQAAELIALAPDVIVATGSLGAEVMVKATHTIPLYLSSPPTLLDRVTSRVCHGRAATPPAL